MDSGVFSGLRQFEVLIRIYVNMEGMVKVCNNGESLNSPTDFTVFAREFNMQHEMCDIIDAGKGKECSDTKLRGEFSTTPSAAMRPSSSLTSQASSSCILMTFTASTSYSVALPITAMLDYWALTVEWTPSVNASQC